MRPTRFTNHIPRPPKIASGAVSALAVSLSLVAGSSGLRAQTVGGSRQAPAITSTGGPSGVYDAASGGESNNFSGNSGFLADAERTEVAPAALSPWTADRSLPDKAGQLRPQYAHPDPNTAPPSEADLSQPAPEFGRVDGTGSVALAGQVVTASATAATANPPAMSAANDSALTQATDGVQHIPLAPPSKRLTGDKPQASGSTLQMLVSIISSLLLVVGLFLGVAWCYRKSIGTSLAGGLPKQVVSVIGRTSISARQQLVLVRFGSKLLLVSVIQGEARTLGEISDPLEVDQMLGQCESGQPGSISQSFKSLLHSEGA